MPNHEVSVLVLMYTKTCENLATINKYKQAAW